MKQPIVFEDKQKQQLNLRRLPVSKTAFMKGKNRQKTVIKDRNGSNNILDNLEKILQINEHIGIKEFLRDYPNTITERFFIMLKKDNRFYTLNKKVMLNK